MATVVLEEHKVQDDGVILVATRHGVPHALIQTNNTHTFNPVGSLISGADLRTGKRN